MAKKKKSKKPKHYGPLGEYLNPETALVQSAMLLDEAAFHAIESKDTEAMAGISRGWMELGAALHNINLGTESDEDEGEEDEDTHDLTTRGSVMGFNSAERREVLENAYKS